jgi:hypothetical protein
MRSLARFIGTAFLVLAFGAFCLDVSLSAYLNSLKFFTLGDFLELLDQGASASYYWGYRDDKALWSAAISPLLDVPVSAFLLCIGGTIYLLSSNDEPIMPVE